MSKSTRAAFVESLTFSLDPFQERSLDLLDSGESVLVAAPTGSGKTLVGLYAIFDALHRGRRAFYTTPLKALSNQKFLEFSEHFGSERVGLLTGDNSIRPEAPIVVMTTEVLRNMIYAGSRELESLGLVVLDEVHYLQNPYRGSVWEEVIIHLPSTVTMVCLSATVSNAEEFAAWMKTVRGSMEAVIEEKRPVELEHFYIFRPKGSQSIELMPTFVGGRPNPDGPDLDSPWLSQSVRRSARPRASAPPRPDVVEALDANGMLPAIHFIFSRAGCDDAVREVMNSGIRLTSQSERSQIRQIVDEHLDLISEEDLKALRFREFITALETGVAAHHAGMVPPFREVVEACFEPSLIKVVFATETLALGINMPARTVIVDKLMKFNGERHELLSPGEYTQLSGRAGRRGLDAFGYCGVLWNGSTTFAQASSLAQTRAYPISSSFRPTYNMASNLVSRYDEGFAKHLMNLSFAQFGADSEVVELESELSKIRLRIEEEDERVQCHLGSMDEYISRKEERNGGRLSLEPPVRHIKAGIRFIRLRPGDVLSVPSTVSAAKRVKLLVVSSGVRGRDRVKITVVSTSGRAYRLGVRFQELTNTEGSIQLPRPYLPNSKEYRKDVARLLGAFSSPHLEDGEPEVILVPANDDSGVGDLDDDAVDQLAAVLSECPEFKEHLAAARRRDRLIGKSEEISKRVRSKIESLGLQLDRVVELLTKYDYVSDWTLTETGDRLARIFCETDLLCSLAMEDGLFDGLDVPGLAALVSTLTYESRPNHKDGEGMPTKALAHRFRLLMRAWTDLVETETAARLPATRSPEAGFAVPIHRWARGLSLAESMAGLTIPPGDFVRNAKQVIDLLRQLSEVSHMPQTRATAREAHDAIFRGVIAISSQVYAQAEAQNDDDDPDGESVAVRVS